MEFLNVYLYPKEFALGVQAKRLLIFVLVVAAVVIAWTAAQFVPPAPAPPFHSTLQLRRAAWVEIDWAMEPHTDAEIEALAADFQRYGITDGYFYVSYLNAGGEFNPTFDHAADFTRRFRAAAPDIRLLAWIGVPISITTENGRELSNRLSDSVVRTQIVAFSNQMIELGFDGIHLNAEPISDGDTAYLATLSELRSGLPEGAFLSVAPHALRLTEPVLAIPYPTIAHHWSADYLRQVASQVDQVAVMAYDSGLFFPTDYRAWMAYQVRSVTAALAETDVEVFIGLPTSEEDTPSHRVGIESLDNALYGLRLGLAHGVSANGVDGIAIYPYWETSADEWERLAHVP